MNHAERESRRSIKVASQPCPPSPPPLIGGDLHLTGVLNQESSEAVTRHLFEHFSINSAHSVTVDVSDVSFLDFDGLAVLVSAQRWMEQHGRTLAVTGVSIAVNRPPDGLTPTPLATPVLESTNTVNQVSDAMRLQDSQQQRTTNNRAIGLIMELHHCDAGQAGVLLAQASHRHEIDLNDLASCLVAVGVHHGRETTTGDRWDLDALIGAGVGAALSARTRSLMGAAASVDS